MSAIMRTENGTAAVYKNSDELLTTLTSALPVGIFLADAHARCRIGNERWAQLTGISSGVSQSWLQSVYPEDQKRVATLWQRCVNARREFSLEFRLLSPDGIVSWVDMRAGILQPNAPDPEYLGITVDITARKLVEEELHSSEARYKQIIHEATDLICQISPLGHFTFVNPIAPRILKYSAAELVGRNYLEIVVPAYQEEVHEFYLRQMQDRTPTTYYEFPVVDKEGKELWLGQNVNLVMMGNVVTGLQSVARDITTRKIAERRLFTQDSVALSLAHSASVEEAITQILEIICSTLCWEVGAFWQLDSVKTKLHCTTSWHHPEMDVADFIARSKELFLTAGEGLPGRVWESATPIWSSNVYFEESFSRFEAARKAKIQGAFSFPILFGKEVLGVLEFFSRESRQQDQDLLSLMTNIGSQIGQFMERIRAEAAVQASDARKSAILESALDCIITIDHQGLVTEFNPAAERTFGYTRAEALGKLMGDLIVPESYRAAHQEGVARYVTTGVCHVLGQRIEITAQRKDGTEFPVELAITPIQIGEQQLFTGYLRDITEAKKAQAELQHARDAAEAGSVAKSQFLAVMSHEIRTPLNAIIGMTDLAIDTKLESERDEYLQTIQSSSEILLDLINDILDFSKIEAGQMGIDEISFSLNQVVENVMTLLMPRARAKELILECVVPPGLPEKVIGDPYRLRQILLNLLSNAVKFTERGKITLWTEVSEQNVNEKMMIRFSVLDTGIGIAQEHQAQIFEKFSQADLSTTRKYGGSGLGLSISKSLAELMGGTLTLTSELRKGSEFCLQVPFRVVEPESIPKPKAMCPMGYKSDKAVIAEKAQAEVKANSASILVVEDNSDNQKLAKMFLQSAGYSVEIAHNGLEGVSCVKAKKYDLILMDIQMPEMDGFMATRKIREDEKTRRRKSTPIIALTAHAIEGYREECLQAGMDDYLTKPIQRQELVATIQRHLSQEKIIVVADDAPENQMLIETYLKHEPYQLKFVQDGQQVLDCLARYEVALLLLDMEMPVLNGYETAQKLRMDETTRSLPIVALTAHAGLAERNRCLAAGCTEYLAKPFKKAALVQLMDTIFKNEANFEPVSSTTTVWIEEDIWDLVPYYLNSQKNNIEVMRQALDSGEYLTVQKLAHNTKGSGASYGFSELTRLGGLLEAGAKKTDVAEMRNLLLILENYLSVVEIKLRKSSEE